MDIEAIISDRKISTYRSIQIVYSWENIIKNGYPTKIFLNSNWIGFVLRNINKISIIRSLFLYLNSKYKPTNYYLYFSMDAETTGIKIDRLSNVLPIIIDYWLSEEQYEEFCNYYSSTKCLLITSKEVYTYLLSKNIPIPIKHFPLSIPDDNVSADYLHCPKEFDFLFAGRRDPVFWEYMKLYEKEHPEIEYLYQELEEQKPVYISNKRGKLEGDFFSREGYLNLLRKSRITFYATPGMDKTKNANGFNQVTPRFLELLASGCLVMGRYIENPDTEFYELNKYCPLVETYDDFKSTLNLFFDREWSANHISHYYTYLQKHITSTRTPILKQILSSL